MVHLIVGHRGVGKTTFLNKLKSSYNSCNQEVLTFDLDEQIEKATGKTITQIFTEKGEPAFREIERQQLLKLCEEYRDDTRSVWIAAGAGLIADLPTYLKVIWLRRNTDVMGRIFLNRPQLDKDLSPLEEYRSRFMPRSARFRAWYHKQVLLPEGPYGEAGVWPYVLGLKPAQINASITVLPEHFMNEIRLEDFITEKMLLGIRYFELRDDLLNAQQMDRLMQEIPADRILVSFRTKDSMKAPTRWWTQYTFDWATELGKCPFGDDHIRSLHYRKADESFTEICERLMSHKADHYKLAIPVQNWHELWQGHKWYMEDPEKRSFLPMSSDGRWLWYRSMVNERMKINFVCDGEGSSFDQPSLYDWLSAQVVRPKHKIKDFSFAAVLGDPVDHSYTPTQQKDFFQQFDLPVFKIRIRENELDELSLSILRRIGLQAAAVTAPHKKTIAGLCEKFSSKAKQLLVVNTICWSDKDKCWIGANTDVEALAEIIGQMAFPKNLVVWGGGGMRLNLMRILPNALFYSARYGDEVQGNNKDIKPEMLIWAVGRNRQADCKWPDESWSPKMVLDLNYTENSPGREYAQRVNARYISGLGLFEKQAELQRQFWLQHLQSESKHARV